MSRAVEGGKGFEIVLGCFFVLLEVLEGFLLFGPEHKEKTMEDHPDRSRVLMGFDVLDAFQDPYLGWVSMP